jgi:hypothetical protein
MFTKLGRFNQMQLTSLIYQVLNAQSCLSIGTFKFDNLQFVLVPGKVGKPPVIDKGDVKAGSEEA